MPGDSDLAKDSGADTTVTDETANQPGPGGSMPSGTLAPHPLIPVNFAFRAEGSYCRFEDNPSRAMIWGRLFRQEGAGQFDSESTECTERCQGKGLGINYRYQGAEASEALTLDDAPHFRFVIDIDDPKQFSLHLSLLPVVADTDLTSTKTNPSSWVDVSDFQPYAVDGAPAFCPTNILMKGITTRPMAPVSPPVEMHKLSPQR
ncbi:MAG TPA: hypothetical protein VFX30_04425 [bacterium]|nr:hypothetical protein [bacterium]